ncbi:MAG: Zn-dependent hydrolase [Planctomycetes bacterium]|nr:Zn-dependent hydrolase [Planctomycetota bacterium]
MSERTQLDGDRLFARLEALGQVGALAGGGVSRLALTDADRAGRDLLVAWMRELGMHVEIDRIGNVSGTRAGSGSGAPVMTGSHIDSVRAGGRFDGALGVLAGLEVVQRWNELGVRTARPLVVSAFTNEEGARFAPDMLGSAVHQGALALDAALDVRAIDGARLGDELERIGYAGDAPVGLVRPHAYVELHVEQGPVLEREGFEIGAVEAVQGISWTEFRFVGTPNHAGTTPMSQRHDALYVVARLAGEVRRLVTAIGGAAVGTVGRVEVAPNLVNVVPGSVTCTVDLRNTDEALLREAERTCFEAARRFAAEEGVAVEQRSLARFEPVPFDESVISAVERCARARGRKTRRLPSGAGHDAQMFAPHAPTGMIFVPSRGGISHNPAEWTSAEECLAGAEVLQDVLRELAG